MGLFKGMKQTKERQKAKAFYDRSATLPPGSRETRKLRSVLGNRVTAFIDLTFIDGAKRTEAYLAAAQVALAQGKSAPEKPKAACYREVKTVGGAVFMYPKTTLINSLNLAPNISRVLLPQLLC